MKTHDPLTLTEETIRQIRKGAFLTVKAGDALNTMTIGWATIGFVWQRPALRMTEAAMSVIWHFDTYRHCVGETSNERLHP